MSDPKAKRKRAARGPVTAVCLSCKWTATGTTWRPVKRALQHHTFDLHSGVAR